MRGDPFQMSLSVFIFSLTFPPFFLFAFLTGGKTQVVNSEPVQLYYR